MYNLTTKVFSAIIFLIFTACSPSVKMEQEPNDSMNQSNKIEVGKEIYGYINSINDVDNFVLSIDEDQILCISLSAIKGVNHAIKVYRADKTGPSLIKIIDDNRKSSPEKFANLFVCKGTYIISILHGEMDIKKFSTDSKYQLIVSTRSFLNEEKEPNDSPESANLIKDGISLYGIYSPARNRMNKDNNNMLVEEDWFFFKAVLSDNKPVIADINLSGVNGIDSLMKVYDGTLNEIACSDNSGVGDGEFISDFGITKPGIYYIVTASKNYQFDHDNQYELSLKIRDFDQTREFEQNNSFDTANAIIGSEITGKISTPEDKDFYFFTSSQINMQYRIELINLGSIDMSMTVYNQNREKLLAVNNSLSGEGEIIPAINNASSFFIVVDALSESNSNNTYNIKITPLELKGNFETEPNDSIKSANILKKDIYGFTNKVGENDYFLVTTNSRQKIKITATGAKTAKIKISTTDPLGYIISTKRIIGVEEISFVEMFNKIGYIIVETEKTDFYNPYKINIEAIK